MTTQIIAASAAAAAGADAGGGPAPPATGDITAKDPLGLAVGQDVAWTIDPADPPPPGPGGVKTWNPGHYLHLQGQPSDATYFNDLATQITNNLGDIPEIIGAHYAIAWGQINPTGSTFDWTELDTLLAQIQGIGDRKTILQLQYKTFRTDNPSIEAPADILDQVVPSNNGNIAAVWRDSVMDRYILALQAIAARYEGDPNFEMVMTTESAPSFSEVGAPGDYNTVTFAPVLKRMYAEAGAAFGTINFAPNVNHLGGNGSGNLSWDLIEEIYQLRLFTGGPDVAPTGAWLNFEGLPASGSAPTPPRDYRGQLGSLYTFSAPILRHAGNTPASLINDMQAHQATHYSWISNDGAANTYDVIKAAIQADPGVHTACPTRYLEGCAI